MGVGFVVVKKGTFLILILESLRKFPDYFFFCKYQRLSFFKRHLVYFPFFWGWKMAVKWTARRGSGDVDKFGRMLRRNLVPFVWLNE